MAKMDTFILILGILGSCIAGVVPKSANADGKQSGSRVEWAEHEPIRLGQNGDERNISDTEDKHSNPRIEDPKHLQKIEDEKFNENEVEFNSVENSNEILRRLSQNQSMEDANILENAKESNSKERESSEVNISIPEDGTEFLEIDPSISTAFAILNLTNDVIDFQIVTENSSSINSMSFDEAELLSEGSEIALFQESSTTGFEFLIDSETRKNFLAELLTSQDFLANEGTETTDLDESETLVATQSSVDLKDIDVELNTTDQLKETLNETVNFGILTSSENESLVELITSSGDAELISDAPVQPLKCPAPGFCLFSFFRRDVCSQNRDCDGSRICCKSGCSMVCMDMAV